MRNAALLLTHCIFLIWYTVCMCSLVQRWKRERAEERKKTLDQTIEHRWCQQQYDERSRHPCLFRIPSSPCISDDTSTSVQQHNRHTSLFRVFVCVFKSLKSKLSFMKFYTPYTGELWLSLQSAKKYVNALETFIAYPVFCFRTRCCTLHCLILYPMYVSNSIVLAAAWIYRWKFYSIFSL